jgi:peptidyl-prolyl cis-trans isomerase D
MLQNIRDNVQGTMAKIIIAIIIVPFAAFGIDSLFSTGSTDVAEVNGEGVSELEFQQGLFLYKRQLASQEEVDWDALDDNKLREPVLAQLTQRKIFLHEADRQGVTISEAALDQAVISNPAFQENGVFSRFLYEDTLRSNGFTPALYKKLTREQVLVSQLTDGLGISDFATIKDLEVISRFSYQKRDFRFITVPYDSAAAQLTVSDEEVGEYYQANISRFMSEEQVQLEYLELKQSDYYEEVSEQDVLSNYQAELESFVAAEERRVAHIMLEINDERNEEQARGQLQDLKNRIAQGEGFAKLAQEYSDDIGSAEGGGDLGFTTGDTFPDEFEEAAFSLAAEQISDPVVTDSGVHLIKVLEIAGAEPPSLEERRVALVEQLKKANSETLYVEKLELLKDISFTAADLTDPAQEVELTVQTSALFGREGGEALFANSKLVAAAFSDDVLTKGHNSNVIELTPDHAVVVRVKEHREPAPRSLEEVSAQIKDMLLIEKQVALLNSRAEGILESIKQGLSVEDAAKQENLEWQVSFDTLRTAVTVNEQIIKQVFALDKPVGDQPSYQQFNLDNGDVIVLQLDKVSPGGIDDIPVAERRAMQGFIARGKGGQSLSYYQDSLRSAAEISIF